MVAYNFKPPLVPKIEDGTKVHTLRPKGKRRHAKIGDSLQLYQGQRTKSCRLIMRGTCWLSSGLVLDLQRDKINLAHANAPRRVADLDAFAIADGFPDYETMRRFFITEYPGRPILGDMVLVAWQKPSWWPN